MHAKRNIFKFLLFCLALSSCNVSQVSVRAEKHNLAIESAYHALCMKQRELVLASIAAFKSTKWESCMEVLCKSTIFDEPCNHFINEAKAT